MTQKQIKELTKYIKKIYWEGESENKHIRGPQRLVVDTFEDRVYDPINNHGFDVCVCGGRFLFTISNYHMMRGLERNVKGELFEIWDSVQAASLPFYIDQHFFLKTWGPITDNDVLKCTCYFIHNVLNLKYSIWNITVKEQPKSEILLSDLPSH